jgi:hypothetical protein
MVADALFTQPRILSELGELAIVFFYQFGQVDEVSVWFNIRTTIVYFS